jgi:malonyl-CoA O-methyltransferase
MTVLSARAAYQLWAPHYDAETAVSYLEDRTVATLGVATSGRRLLDAGCGTGRRLRAAGAAPGIGVDLTFEMLGRARGDDLVSAADVRALPFAAESFDVVWCRLVIGHVADARQAYAELARVCRVDGVVIVTDLCSEAIAAGHRRTFRDSAGMVHEVEHFMHSVDVQERAARDVGLERMMRRDGVVGPDIKRFYHEAGRLSAYTAQLGLPIVVATSWRKGPSSR